MDLMGLGRLAVIGFAIFMLFSIASQPGLFGKLFVVIIIVMLYFMFRKIQKDEHAPDPVNDYYTKLRKLCRLKGPGGLSTVRMTGDYSNFAYSKGNIIGGPVREINFQVDAKSPKRQRLIYLYTPDTSWMFKLPVVSWIMNNFRKEFLIAIYHNPEATISQLVSRGRMASKDARDRNPVMAGNLLVRGVNTYAIGEMEFVNDEFFDYDAEMKLLGDHVHRLTLEDNLRHLPDRIRKAVDSNSTHVRTLDLKDFVGGVAKPDDKL